VARPSPATRASSPWSSAAGAQRFFDRTFLEEGQDSTPVQANHRTGDHLQLRHGRESFRKLYPFRFRCQRLPTTSEVEYGFTQRLFRKDGDGQLRNSFPGAIMQKHYFDPPLAAPSSTASAMFFRRSTPLAFRFRFRSPQLVSDRQRFTRSLPAACTIWNRFFNTIPKSKDSSPSARS